MGTLTVFLLLVVLVASENLNQNKTFNPIILKSDITANHSGIIPLFGTRIIGGQVAQQTQFPYQAGLEIDLGRESSFCGGSLISTKAVLTAAHCCERARKINVVLGSVKIHDQSEPNRKVITVSGRSIKIHENWSSNQILNDICILKLPEEVELSEYISTVDLPKDDSRDFTEANVIASGWGLVSDGANAISPVLKYVKLKVIRNSLCNIFFFGSIRDTNICTSGQGSVSTCSGDSGGPIVLESNSAKNPIVIGITSFGTSLGCERGFPAVFTRVSKYLRWIQFNMI